MKFNIEVHFDNKGQYDYVQECNSSEELGSLLLYWANECSDFILVDDNNPTLINLSKVMAIVSTPYEEEAQQEDK